MYKIICAEPLTLTLFFLPYHKSDKEERKTCFSILYVKEVLAYFI